MKKLILAAICCLCLCGCSFDEEMEWLGFEKESTTSNGSSLILTKNKYDKIDIDMSYSEVKTILGGECELQYENTTNFETYESYVCWDKVNSSKRIVIKFENNKLSSKAQVGL